VDVPHINYLDVVWRYVAVVFFSSNFWGCVLFSFIGVEVLFLVLRVG
jgi:hypothetical protein